MFDKHCPLGQGHCPQRGGCWAVSSGQGLTGTWAHQVVLWQASPRDSDSHPNMYTLLPHLRTRKLRPREEKQPAPGHSP
jgi:hypothetical protein